MHHHASSTADQHQGTRPPLWPYLLAFLGLVILGLAFGEMAQRARQQAPEDLDLQVHTWVVRHNHDWPRLTWLFRALTGLGNPEVATASTILVAVLLIVLGRRRIARLRRREALFWLGVAISSRFLCVLLKLWFRRLRPPVGFHLIDADDSFSFPSGHSVYAAVFFSMLAILIARALPAHLRWPRYLIIGACALLAVSVGASRVWLNVHYPSDVLGGLLLGVAWVIAAYTIRYGWSHWRWHRRSRAAAGSGRATEDAEGAPRREPAMSREGGPPRPPPGAP